MSLQKPLGEPTSILFPHDPRSRGAVDREFEAELRAARDAGFETILYDHRAAAASEDAIGDLPATASRRSAILRGWMLPGERYETLLRRLDEQGYELLTSPTAYEEAHYLPLAYRHIEAATARSAWIEGDDVEQAWELYQGFRDRDAIIKDWVKSAKRRWKEGCFIPARSDETRFREIYDVFRATRGALFNRGVVLRGYMPIVEHGFDIRGLPLAEETRLFFWRGELMIQPDSRSPSPMDEAARWTEIARRFQSPFLSLDVAYLTDGTWRIVEVGDGGVSGLPMGLSPERFYERLWCMITAG